METKYNSKLRNLCLFGMSLIIVAGMAACGDSPTMTERFEATGEIQGTIIDRATGDAISDVAVTLLYGSESDTLENQEDFGTRTTDSNGSFTFSEVPVNTDAKGGSGSDRKSTPYMLRLEVDGNDDYRDTYLARVDVIFESTGGDGAAVNMVSNITIPLSKRSVGVAGKVNSERDTNVPLTDATVELYQEFNPVINGSSSTESTMYLTSTSTNSDGEFSFSNVEENASIFFRVKSDSDSTNVVNWQSSSYTTPSSSDGDANLDVGTFTPTGSDLSSKFNVTVIGKAVQQNTEKPLEDVNVFIKYSGGEIVDTTVTAEDGSFEFTGVEEDSNMRLKFQKLDDENEVYDQTTGIFSTPAVRGESEIVEDRGNIQLNPQDRSGAFYVMSITPERGADLESDELEFVFEFNRSVIANEYTRTDLGFGSGTIKDDISFDDDGFKKLFGGDLNFSVEFNEDRTTLTITPDPDDLEDAKEYTLNVEDAFSDNRFTDENGKNLEFGTNFPFENDADVYTRPFSINDNDAVPHTPEVALVTDPETIDWDQGSVNIEWELDESDADVRHYEVWRSEDGAPFEHQFNSDPDNFSFGEISATVNISDGELVNRRGNVADSPKEVRIRVRAISSNLVEGEYSDIITITDNVDPEVDGADQNSATQLTIFFNEPMDKSSVESATYTFFDAAEDEVEVDIESITYQVDQAAPGNAGNPRVVIVLDEDSENDFDDTEEVEVEGATDLAGNDLDEDNNSATY